MSTFNRQEAFDIAVKGIITQGGPAVNVAGDCRYRGDHGRKCAVGFLIPDEDYSRDIEGDTVRGDKLSTLALKHNWDINFLERLQTLHDNTQRYSAAYGRYVPRDPEDYLANFRKRAREFAVDYGLDPSSADYAPVPAVE